MSNLLSAWASGSGELLPRIDGCLSDLDGGFAPKIRSNATAPFSAHVTATPKRASRRAISCLVIASSSTTSPCKGVSRCNEGCGDDDVVFGRAEYGGEGGFTGVGRAFGACIVSRSGKAMNVGRFVLDLAVDMRSSSTAVVSEELGVSVSALVNGSRCPVDLKDLLGISSTSPPRRAQHILINLIICGTG